MIKLQNVSKSFGNKTVVNDLTLEIPEGKIFGFLGPNGAGKSTTIKMISGIEKPDSGEIFINNIDILKSPLLAKTQIAYVPDEPVFYSHMTGIQYLNFISDIFGISVEERKKNIEEYADAFNFLNELKEFTNNYSHGMKQKLSLISAFIHNPKVIILDEPMVGLDAKAAKTVKQLLKDFTQKGNTVFFSTHVMDTAERFCECLAIISQGNLIFTGTFDNLKNIMGENNSTLEDLFLELTEAEKK
ncbi:MAG: ABC transporter ATP-binding protein [Spirochaetia bacterium]|nr:ABC transporter ATP-binding protein [Spirochaetia bacterium]